jgi:hypothetical protein
VDFSAWVGLLKLARWKFLLANELLSYLDGVAALQSVIR